MEGYRLVGPLAYQGKADCQSVICTNMFNKDGTRTCRGWHCFYCDEPCSYQGHSCDAANSILGESHQALKELEEK